MRIRPRSQRRRFGADPPGTSSDCLVATPTHRSMVLRGDTPSHMALARHSRHLAFLNSQDRPPLALSTRHTGPCGAPARSCRPDEEG